MTVDDLRGFLAFVQSKAPREYLTIAEPLDARWELAAFTEALVKKMRMPVIEYTCVNDATLPVVHNVCASLSRIAKSCGCSTSELESRLASAYDHLIEPVRVTNAPVRESLHTHAGVDLGMLPQVFYTDTQTQPYISAAQVVAVDPDSGSSNISFHRLMIIDRNKLAIYMTPNGHLDRVFRRNAMKSQDTPVAAFIGAHPLWSLGSLAAGALSLDEMSVIGGLQGYPLSVVAGIHDETLLIPSHAEIAIEGYLSHTDLASEGPYGEAFGFVSAIDKRPVFHVTAMSHRHDPIFQDIVPGQLEHMTMTGLAVQVHLQKTLRAQFDFVTDIYLPTPMTVYVSVSDAIKSGDAHALLHYILAENRFIKHAVLFDQDIDIGNARQAQHALAMRVQADRDVLLLPKQSGNGLDPSELDGQTTKWGIDASSYAKFDKAPVRNRIPPSVSNALDVAAILKRASGQPGKRSGD